MRTKNKIFRLTELQLEQLEKHLEKEGTTFTDFIHSLIQREVMQDVVTVRQPTEEELKPRTKIKTVIEVVKRYQKTDPNRQTTHDASFTLCVSFTGRSHDCMPLFQTGAACKVYM